MSDEQLSNKIKEELLKSGFPLGLRCRRVLYQHKWAGSLNRFYIDSEGTEREIDAMAHKQTIFSTNSRPHNTVNSILIVECKRNQNNHWVFFDEDLGLQFINVISTLDTKQNEQIEWGVMKKLRSLRRHHYFEMKATSSFSMAFKSPKGKNQIFEGLQELFAAYKNERETVEKNMKRTDCGEGIWVNVYYPVLVLEGKLFIATMVREDLKVEEIDQVLYTAQHPSYLDTWTTIDVVRADFFPNYLDSLDQDHEIIVSYIQSKIS